MCLAKINLNRVAPHIGEKLKLYQLKVIDVLYKQFLAENPVG